MEMKQLIDSSSSLMERFKDAAPGTYRHCQNVAQLCESVGKELKIDIDSLVVAATLHDIGKCNNPNYFIENQDDGKNPHEELDPKVSFQYISRHVSDGVLKLVQLGLPLNIIQIVSEHHGNSVMKAIFSKAKEKYNGSTVEDHYRYKSQSPSTIEACVLMVCDVMESACRAAFSNNHSDADIEIKIIVNRLMDSMTEDEQLDILTLGHIRIIKKVIIKELENIFHKRIEYDLKDE